MLGGALGAHVTSHYRVLMRTRTGWLIYLLAFWVVLVGWAMASPMGSAPDDDYHLASIWCAEGVAADACSDEGVDAQSLAVPSGY